MRGRQSEAIGYLTREIVISDSLDRRSQNDQLSELATVYHLQEEQLARYEAEAEAERSQLFCRKRVQNAVCGKIISELFCRKLYF